MKQLTLNHNREFSTNVFDNGQAQDSMSDNYKPISTSTIISGLEDEGFYITGTSAVQSRKIENRPYAKHLVRMSHVDFREQLDGDRPEIVITNSLNGTSSLKIMLGIYRFICSNGMIAGDTLFHRSVKHIGNGFYSNVIDAVLDGAEKFPQVQALIETLKNTNVDATQVMDLKQRIREEILTPLLTDSKTVRLEIDTRMNPRRIQDQKSDIWTIVNRFQEYLIRGGIKYQKIQVQEDNNLKRVVNTTRQVKSIDRKIKLNQQIMDLTLDQFNIAA